MLKEDAFKRTRKKVVKAATILNKQDSILMSIFMNEKDFDQPNIYIKAEQYWTDLNRKKNRVTKTLNAQTQ